jgi:hypothetical protein
MANKQLKKCSAWFINERNAMWYNYMPTRKAKATHDNNKCWQGQSLAALLRCWWNANRSVLSGKWFGSHILTQNIHPASNQVHPGRHPVEIHAHRQQETCNTHGSIIYKSPKWKATQMVIRMGWWIHLLCLDDASTTAMCSQWMDLTSITRNKMSWRTVFLWLHFRQAQK